MTYSVNCSTLFLDVPLLRRPAEAKAAGFDHIEFWWPFTSPDPPSVEIDTFVAAVQDADVNLTALNLFAGDHDAGERGVLSDRSRIPEFRDSVAVAAAIGERLGCRLFNALYGNVGEASRGEHEETAIQNTVHAAKALATVRGTVLLEALSGAPAYPLKLSSDVFSLIEKAKSTSGSTNVKILADFYHLARNGDHIETLIQTHAPAFGHVQIADAPGRGAPGSGSLPVSDWIHLTKSTGYNGMFALEYFSNNENPFGWLQGSLHS